MNAGKRKRHSVRLGDFHRHASGGQQPSSIVHMGPPARPLTRQQFLSVKPSVLGIYLYISAIIILVYNTRLEYHCMHEHVRSTACSICVRSSGMGETARGAGTGCVRPAGKKRRHNGTSWRHVIIFGGSFSHLCRRRRSAGTAMHSLSSSQLPAAHF